MKPLGFVSDLFILGAKGNSYHTGESGYFYLHFWMVKPCETYTTQRAAPATAVLPGSF